MTTGVGVVISTRPDGSSATIDILYPENINGYPVNYDDVMLELTKHNVVNGIYTFEIEEAIKRVNETNQPVSGILVAKALIEKEVFFYGVEGAVSPAELSVHVAKARQAYKLYIGDSDTPDTSGVIFVNKGELLYKINMQDSENIFGKSINDRPLPVNLHRGNNVGEESDDGTLSYLAQVGGYLGVDDEMRLCVLEPFIARENNLILNFSVLPVLPDKLGELFRLCQRCLVEKASLGLKVQPLQDTKQKILDIYNNNSHSEVLICKGRSPIPGKAAWLEITAEAHVAPKNETDEKIDFAEFSTLNLVGEGDVLGYIHHATRSRPGLDVLGAEVIPREEVGREINLGGNVTLQSGENKDAILAKTSGILKTTPTSVDVLEALVISGDINASTGNVRFDKSIIVTGDIKGGYLVECGEDLTVRGSIEAGARVTCGGNLIVFKGVFGKESQILVKGEANVGYIHEGRIQVGRNLDVYKYISDSCVKCRGSVRVLGQGVKGFERGAVMGGEVYALESMKLHSVGTKSMVTKLGCGYDPDLLKQLKQSRAVLSSLETKVINIQKTSGIDLKSPRFSENLKRMPEGQRLQVIQKLKEIKELLARHESLTRVAQELESKTYAQNMDNVVLTIERHMVPKVNFIIGNAIHLGLTFMSGITLRRGRNGVYLSSIDKKNQDNTMV